MGGVLSAEVYTEPFAPSPTDILLSDVSSHIVAAIDSICTHRRGQCNSRVHAPIEEVVDRWWGVVPRFVDVIMGKSAVDTLYVRTGDPPSLGALCATSAALSPSLDTSSGALLTWKGASMSRVYERRIRVARNMYKLIVTTKGAHHNYNMSLLHMACAQKNLPMVWQLLRAGADPCTPELVYAYTPIHMVLDQPPWSPNSGIVGDAIISELLRAGADPNARTHADKCPLEIALLMRRSNCARILLEAGAHANADMRSEDMMTMLGYAIENRLIVIAGLLVRHGASPDEMSRDEWVMCTEKASSWRMPEIQTLLATSKHAAK